MTTPATGRELTSACNGVTTVFNCPVFVGGSAFLKVYLLTAADQKNSEGTLLAEGADYAIAGDGRAGTAQITTTVAQPAGKWIRRWRRSSRAQGNDYVANDGFPADSHELALDRLSLVDEELDDDIADLQALEPRVDAAETAIADETAARAAADLAILAALPGIPANATLNAVDRVILSALGRILPAYLSEPGEQGMFAYDLSDLSAEVTADTQKRNYVAPAAATGLATDGSDGAWVRQPYVVAVLGTVTRKPKIGVYDLPAGFLDTIGGTQVVYDGVTGTFTRSRYDALDTFSNDPATIHYYVNFATGDNADDGLTEGTAFKYYGKARDTVRALAAGSKAVIHLKDRWLGFLSNFVANSDSFDGKLVKVIGEGPEGFTRIFGAIEDDTPAAHAWVAHGTRAWKTNTAGPVSRAYKSMLDGDYHDSRGLPLPFTYAANAAAVQTTPRSWFNDGTWLYVAMHDGRKPDFEDGWIANYQSINTHYSMDSGTALFENIEFSRNSGTSVPNADACFIFAAKNAVTFVSAAKIGFRNSAFYGENGWGIYASDAEATVTEGCRFGYCGRDLIAYQSFKTLFPSPGYVDGRDCTGYEDGNTGHQAGWAGWRDYAGTSNTDNASTSHNAYNMVRVGCDYSDTQGAVVIDVTGGDIANFFVKAGSPGATAGVKASFAYEANAGEGIRQRMVLIGCEGSDDDPELAINVAGTHADRKALVQYWQGNADAKVSGPIYSYPDEVRLA